MSTFLATQGKDALSVSVAAKGLPEATSSWSEFSDIEDEVRSVRAPILPAPFQRPVSREDSAE